MLLELYRSLPVEGVKIIVVLFLSFLTGLEREEHLHTDERYFFGGVRTFPLIGLIGYGVSLLASGEILPVTIGFAVVAAFLMLLLLAQAHHVEARRPHVRDVRPDDIPGGRPCLPGTVLDRHHDCRGEHPFAGTEVRAGRADKSRCTR